MANAPLNLAGASGSQPITIAGLRSFYTNYGASAYQAVLSDAINNGFIVSVKGYSNATVTMAQNRSSSSLGWDSVYLDGVLQPNSTSGGTFNLSGVDTLTIKGFVLGSSSGAYSYNTYTITLS